MVDINERIMKAITQPKREFKGKFHVSSLVYDCLRRSYYEIVNGDGFYDIQTLVTFWIGRSVHQTQFLKEHELMIKIQKLTDAINNKQPPVKVPGWLCKYCNFASICFRD